MALVEHAPRLRGSLLRWWQVHGRHDLPWKLSPAGLPPGRGEPLDPYPIWVAEAEHTVSTHPIDSTRLNLAIAPESRDRLERLAELHHRTLSGEVAWLIDAAYRQERAETETA